MQKQKAFTLAEVLITLVVIGIIAAITVPMIMANRGFWTMILWIEIITYGILKVL